jgi:hypothetical protein
MKHSSLYIEEFYHWRGCNTVTLAQCYDLTGTGIIRMEVSVLN